MPKKLLKTDRAARLQKVARHRKRNNSTEFRFRIGRRLCADGETATIPARITYVGQDTGWTALGQKAKWDSIDTENFLVDNEPQKTALLRDLKTRAERLYADCRLSGRPVDVFAIWDALFADDRLIANTPNVQQLVDQWLAYDQVRKDTDEIVERTRMKNERWTNDFWAFSSKKYGVNARLSDLKPGDMQKFIAWLKQSRHLSNNVAQATASHAKVLFNYALDQEWIERNPFINFRRKMDTVERQTLTEDEIKLFCTFPLEAPALQKARDIFFFLNLTGLSYADVERLTAKNIKQEGDERYIHILRRKMLSRSNTVPATIPLSGPVLAILAKYAPDDDSGPLLTLQANAPLNRCLKQIAAMCGLDKSVSTKVARNSLATYLINQGVPLTSVSALLGHSSTTTTQKYYAKVSPKRVIDDMNNLANRLNGNGLFGIESPQDK